MPRARQPTIRSLTGARFVAAILVVCFHFFTAAPAWLNAIFRNGYLGVPFFFVLSGFILTYTYAYSPEAQFSIRSFWIARFARIYPIYLVSLLLYVPFFLRDLHAQRTLIGGGLAADATVIFVLNVTLVQSIIPIKPIVGLLNAPGWTLCVEACFYLLFPVLARRLSKLGVGAALLWILASLAVLALIEGLVIPALPGEGALAGLHGPLLWNDHPLRWFPVFVIGAAVARLFLELRDNHLIQRLCGPATIILSVLLFLGLTLNVPEHLGRLEGTGMATLFGALVFFLAFDRGIVAIALSTWALLALGEASYALYIIQSPVWCYLEQFYSKVLRAGSADSIGFYVILLVLLCVLSLLSHRYFEAPARKAIRRVLGKSDSREASVVAVEAPRAF